MASKINVNVTEEIIREHEKRHRYKERCLTCPVAVAFHVATGNRTLRVNNFYVNDGDKKKVELPKHVQQSIADIDRHEPVAPFAFDIEVPTEWIKDDSHVEG